MNKSQRDRPASPRRSWLTAPGASAVLLAATLAACSSSSQPSKPASGAGSPTLSSAQAASTPSGAGAASTRFTSALSPMPGLQLTWPTPGWRATDGAGEVIVNPPGLPGASLHVTKGLFPAGPDGSFLTKRASAVSAIDALQRLPALEASRPVSGHIGDGLAVVHIDLRLSPTAPHSGFHYLVYKGFSVNAAQFAIKKGMSVRVYAGVYRAPYGRELLDIAVEAPTGKVFARWTALAARALQSLRLPEGLVPNRSIFD